MTYRTFIALTILLCTQAPAAVPQELPGIWRELENGEGHTRIQEMRQASGGKLLNNFNSGSRVNVTFDVPSDMKNARLYLRYNNALKQRGQVSVTDVQSSRQVGLITQEQSANWDDFRWASLPLGPLAGGQKTLRIECPKGQVSGGLDVAVILDDKWDGRYSPPTKFAKGKPVGTGTIIPPIQTTVTPAAKNSQFVAGEAVSFAVTLSNRKSDAFTAPLQWSMTDHAGKVFASGETPLNLAPLGKQEISVSHPSLDHGWYILQFQVDGAALDPHYFTSFRKVTLPATPPAKAVAQEWLGMNMGYADETQQRESVIPDFKAVNLRAIRVGGNKVDPKDHEPMVELMRDAGLQMHWVMNYRGNGVNPNGTALAELPELDIAGPVMKQWFDNYKARCKTYFEYYSQPGRERVRFWICGNEPDKRDAHTGLFGRPDVAVLLCRAMAEAAREVNPDGIVVESPAMAQPDAEYLKTMIVDHGLADHCDVIGVHVYGTQTLDHRIGKPWEWLALANAKRPVACSEAGVTIGWTPKGGDGREWQADFLAHWYVKCRRMGYAYGIMFTHDDDHKVDWAQLRAKGEKLQPTWDLVAKSLTQSKPLTNGDFEAVNDPRTVWIPDRDLDKLGWMENQINFAAIDQVHAGKQAARITPGEGKTRVAAFQLIDRDVTPGKPLIVRGFARSSGSAATLSINGYDPLDGDAQIAKTVTSDQWTPVELTVTPANPWIVIGIEAAPGTDPAAAAWFDSITVSSPN